MESTPTSVSSRQLRVVLIDTREERRSVMIDVVEAGGRALVVAEADGLEAARAAVDQEGAEAVVVDVRMPTAEGLRIVQHLRRVFPQLCIVVCSFDLSAAVREEALLAGADTCLRKPTSAYELVGTIEAALRRHATAAMPVATA